jgi:hypothetical protein
VPVRQVTQLAITAKGSRPFQAVTEDGQVLFVKVFGSDQRDADLLYWAHGAIRLRIVGDMRAGRAVSAVLLYRLATYWLPVLPGWLSWRFLQRREYL